MILEEEKNDFEIIEKKNDENEIKENNTIILDYLSNKKDSINESISNVRNSNSFIEKSNFFERLFTIVDLISDINKIINGLIWEKKLKLSEEILEIFSRITKTLKILNDQYNYIIKILFNDATTNFTNELIKGVKEKNDINIYIMEIANEFILNNLLFEIFLILQKLHRNTLIDKPEKYFVNDLQIQISKLQATIEFLPLAIMFDKEDLFSLPKNHNRWKKLSRISIIINLNSPEIVNNSFKNFVKSIHLASALMVESENPINLNKTDFQKKISIGYGAIYYWFLSKEAKKKAELFYSKPNFSTAIQVWNLPESGFVKKMMKFIFPSINYHKKIFIGRDFQEFTIENNLKDNFLNENPFKKLKVDSNEENTEFSIIKKYEKLLIKSPEKIRIRILSKNILKDPKDPLFFDSKKKKLFFLNEIIRNPLLSWFFPKTEGNSKKIYTDLIIHIHGGGFVSMSSGSHQIYTRKWANMLDAPIFSLDYRLAPKDPYPKALDDCWQAYNWIINNVHSIFNLNVRKIIIAGDSAGGNLALAITMKAINSGIRIPNGLMLSYPALNLSTKYFSPSLLLAINDQIVPYTFLKMCAELYLSNDQCFPESDPYISPILCSNSILQEFPPIRIICGSQDPLHDDCWRFAEKLMDLHKNIKIRVFNGMPHGFLNYDAPNGMNEAKECVKQAAELINELLLL